MINIDNKKFVVEGNTKVVALDKIVMIFPGGKEKELDVKIETDFGQLSPEHHQIFLQSFSDRYNRTTKVYNLHTNYDGSKVELLIKETKPKENLFKRLFRWKKKMK